ncbi:MAG: [FeFe] hydrogenase H-cluster maturation GTPase HydF [Bacteroidetes bacterium 4572_128]|nr:MAG: [FeFe] hydrogenase H-cluster maturation GTPase HydF [Bacteroidetes bacterium 4572_128]
MKNKIKASKPHIGIFGRRNFGKSSLINVLTDQDIAIVSSKAGTTTDPVKKSIEIFGVGPTVIIDTAGIDDKSELGKKRVEKTIEVITTIDLAILVIINNIFGDFEENLIAEFKKYEIPYFIIHNKSDLKKINFEKKQEIKKKFNVDILNFSNKKSKNLNEIINLIVKNFPPTIYKKPKLIEDLIKKDDIILLIMPIDSETPEGRIILPEVQLIRNILDNHSVGIVLQETEIENFFKKNPIKPKLAITDSQVFDTANKLIPKEIPLTSFSVILAREKGNFEEYIKGTPYISKLKDGDKVLIMESCTHQISCEDIGRYKLPAWIKDFTKKKLDFEVVAGLKKLRCEITDYAMVIQCGACVITEKQLKNRLNLAIKKNIPCAVFEKKVW